MILSKSDLLGGADIEYSWNVKAIIDLEMTTLLYNQDCQNLLKKMTIKHYHESYL